jgi:hypothetical protein
MDAKSDRRMFARTLSSLLLAVATPALARTVAEINLPEKHTPPPVGVVAGTLTVDGQKIPLRYAYARRAGEVDAPSAERTKLYVILANQPLAETQFAAIVDGRYAGEKKLAGVMLAIDADTLSDWSAAFISDREISGTAGFTQAGGDDPKVDRGRLTGRISLHNQGAAHERAFLSEFDAPLDTMEESAHCTGTAASSFARLAGAWNIERWSGEEESLAGKQTATYSGTLRIDERLNADQFHGTFRIVVGRGIADIQEQATLTCSGGKVRLNGAVLPETPWSPDAMEFELRGDHLVGDGTDAHAHVEHVALKKIR